MSLFGIGPLELLFVALLALLLIGPKDISRTARSAGRALNRMYRSETWQALNRVSRSLRDLPGTLAREAELDELSEIHSAAGEIHESIRAEMDGLHSDVRALDESGATEANDPS